MVKACGVVLTLNEEPRIQGCLKHLRPYVSYLIVLDDESTDKTVKVAKQIADKVVVEHRGPGMAEKRNRAVEFAPKDCSWILMCDADERFDRGWLQMMKESIDTWKDGDSLRVMKPYVGRNIKCFRFPRLNLPHPDLTYPDYQVRFYRNDADFEWRNEGPPELGNDILYSKKANKRLDRLPSVATMDWFPILHLPRRTDIRRPWW